MQDLERIEGNIVHITFFSEDTGFTVLELESADEYITVVGEMAGVGEGQKLIAYGTYTNHPSFGMQFKAKTTEVILPSTVNAIYKYLSSGAIKGIGAVTAKRIVDQYGEDTFAVIDEKPELLAQVKGLSPKKALAIQAEFKRIYGIQDAIRSFAKLNIPTQDAISLYTFYGQEAYELIKGNPYLLCEEPCLYQFEEADALAERMYMEYDARIRVAGGILFVLRHNSINGHSCVPQTKLVSTVSKFIGVEEVKVRDTMYHLIGEDVIMCEIYEGTSYIYLIDLYVAEMVSSQKICHLLTNQIEPVQDFDFKLNVIQQQEKIEYADLQIEALKKVMQNNVCIITGGPGTGKSTLVKGIISLFEYQGNKVALCAPTGRAAKRLSELSSREAKTIHRLLEVVPGSKNNIRFSRNKDNPIPCDVLIVDEFSMVDVTLFSNLITAIKDKCRVVFVGDYNQLPAVGAGNILKDLISCDMIPKVQLTEIFRQAQQSDIVLNAHAINLGEIPKVGDNKSDYFFINCDEQNIEQKITELISNRLPIAYGYDSNEDIQILSPSRKKRGGTRNLNTAIQQVINPKRMDKLELNINGVTYRVADKVMQTKNNYDLEFTRDDGEIDTGVFNGDIGYILDINTHARSMEVRFEDKTYEYTQDDIIQLEHAWAITVHKSQGCEFKAVILSIPDTVSELQYRNLLYTAFTRAKELLIVVGKPTILANMVANDRKQLRYSGMKYLVKGYYEGIE